MTREVSLYLDVVRFLAAMTVFLGHMSRHSFTGGFLWPLLGFGAEAVTIFFVISGFVIGYATDRREASASSYIVARAARIYSVALPALVLTFLLDAIGRSLRPDLYAGWWEPGPGGQPWQFISSLLFLNEIWFTQLRLGSNVPYWSLCFEVWYYVIFGIAVFAPARWRLPGIAAVLVLVGPLIAAMFPLWLLGLGTYRFCARRELGRVAGTLLYLGSLAGWVAYEIWSRRYGHPFTLIPPSMGRPELALDYVVAGLFAMHLVGVRAIPGLLGPVLNRFARPIRWSAGATFAIYLFHLPVAQFLATLVPWPPDFWATRLFIIGGTLAIVLALAEVTERRKEVWRRGFSALLRQGQRAIRPG